MRTAFLLAVSLATMASLAVRSSADEWLSDDKYKEACATAIEKNVPIVMVLQDKKSKEGGSKAKVRVFEESPELNGLVKIRVYQESRPKWFSDLTKDAFLYKAGPALLVSDGRGHLLGYVSYEASSADLPAAVRQAVSAVRWKKETEESLKTIQTEIGNKQFAGALTELESIAAADLNLAETIAASIKAANLVAWGGGGESYGSGGHAKKKPEAPPKPTEGLFLAAEVKSLQAKAAEAIGAECKRAEELLAGGDAKMAEIAITPLLALKVDAALKARIKELNVKIAAALKPGATTAAKVGENAEKTDKAK